jgi:hypothetical protein
LDSFSTEESRFQQIEGQDENELLAKCGSCQQLGRQRWEDHKFEASLGYVARACLRKPNMKINNNNNNKEQLEDLHLHHPSAPALTEGEQCLLVKWGVGLGGGGCLSVAPGSRSCIPSPRLHHGSPGEASACPQHSAPTLGESMECFPCSHSPRSSAVISPVSALGTHKVQPPL